MTTRYRIIEQAAGEGGFGRIDKAQDTELERFVAIKVLDPLFKDTPSEEDKERFKTCMVSNLQNDLNIKTRNFNEIKRNLELKIDYWKSK